jgi:hypothetical protein
VQTDVLLIFHVPVDISPEILVTPTPGDHATSKILTALHNVKIEGSNKFCSAVQVM